MPGDFCGILHPVKPEVVSLADSASPYTIAHPTLLEKRAASTPRGTNDMRNKTCLLDSDDLFNAVSIERDRLIARPRAIPCDPYDKSLEGLLDALLDEKGDSIDHRKWQRYLGACSGEWFWSPPSTLHYLIPRLLKLWHGDLSLNLSVQGMAGRSLGALVNNVFTEKQFSWKACPPTIVAAARQFQKTSLREAAEKLPSVFSEPDISIDDVVFQHSISWVYQLLSVGKYDDNIGEVIRDIQCRGNLAALSAVLVLCCEIVLLCEPHVPQRWLVKVQFECPHGWIRVINMYLSGIRIGLPKRAQKSLIRALSSRGMIQCCRRWLVECNSELDETVSACLDGVGGWFSGNKDVWDECLSRFTEVIGKPATP